MLPARYQGGGELQAISRAQGMLIQQLRRQNSNLIAWKNFPPRAA